MLFFALYLLAFHLQGWVDQAAARQNTLNAQAKIESLEQRIGDLRAEMKMLRKPVIIVSDVDKYAPDAPDDCDYQCIALCKTTDCRYDTQAQRDQVARCAKQCLEEGFE